jgi:GNAT superfamily N-acetyltransferase
MRDTLVEVLGEERGGSMYSMEWLVARAKWHLDPANCVGEIFLACNEDEIVGHTIVRVETGFGLFSTIYVVPSSRGDGVARALLRRGEEWMRAQGMTEAYTYTDENNEPLKQLFCSEGFVVKEIKNEFAILWREL